MEEIEQFKYFADLFLNSYESVYYVDLVHNTFRIYRQRDYLKTDHTEADNYYISLGKYLREGVIDEDRDKLMWLIDPDEVRTRVGKNKDFSLVFTDLSNGKPRYMRILVMRGEDDDHIIVAFNSMDEDIREIVRMKEERTITDQIIAGLAEDYEAVFLVDADADLIRDVRVTDEYCSNIHRDEGEKSYRARIESGLKWNVVPEDRKKVRNAFNADNLWLELGRSPSFSINYRVRTINGDEIYYRAKFIRMARMEGRFFIVGIKNVNEEMGRELQAEANHRARSRIIDALSDNLTGLYYGGINKESDSARIVKDNPLSGMTIRDFTSGEMLAYMKQFIATSVHPDDMIQFAGMDSLESIRKLLANKKRHTIVFRCNYDGVYKYTEMNLVKTEDADQPPLHVAASFSEVDDMYKDRLELERLREESLVEEKTRDIQDVLTAITDNYEFLIQYDIRTHRAVAFRDIGIFARIFENPGIEKSFDSFIEDFSTMYVIPDDRELVRDAMQMDRVLSETSEGYPYVLTIRILLDSQIMWVEMLIVFRENAEGHDSFIIGIRNIDVEMKAELERQNEKISHEMYKVINGLSDDYDCVLMVDPETFKDKTYLFRGVFPDQISGWDDTDDFEDHMKMIMSSLVSPEDWEGFRKAVTRKSILEYMESKSPFFHTYHSVSGNKTATWQIKFAKVGSRHVKMLLGFHNIDAEIEAYEQRLAVIAELTKDYESVYYISFENETEKGIAEQYREGDTLSRNIPGWVQEDGFHNRLNMMRDSIVYESDRDAFYEQTRKPVIVSHLSSDMAYFVNFRAVIDGVLRYFQMKFTADRKSTGEIIGLVVGIHDVSDEMRSEMQREAALREAKQNAERIVEVRTAELREKNRELSLTNREIIELLGDVVELRDSGTGTHISNVRSFTYILASRVKEELPEYELTDETVELITSASALHDVGKIMIPDSILMKPGRLTPEEFEIMKSHCEKGCRILKRVPKHWNADYYNTCMDICHYHHEKWDGSGYPEGLVGDSIPISAQIVAIADCFDALISERPYKNAYPPSQAFDMILAGECGKFSDKLLNCLRQCREQFERCATDTTYKEMVGSSRIIDTNIAHDSNMLQLDEVTLPFIKKFSESIPGGFCIYQANEKEEFIFFNSLLIQLMGCKNDDEFRALTGNSFRGLIHPDDLETVERSIREQIRTSSDNMDHVRFRAVNKDGSIHWFNDFGHFAHSRTYGDVYYVFIVDDTPSHLVKDRDDRMFYISNNRLHMDKNEGTHIQTKHRSGFEDMHILVADDEEITRDLTQELLEESGADVTPVADGSEAISAFSYAMYDAILMDITMPNVNGIEAIRSIRSIEARKGTHTTIVGITASDSQDDIDACFKAGADDVLHKPLSLVDFSHVLISCMREKSVMMERKLAQTVRIANTDALTQVKNIAAYTDKVAELTAQVQVGDALEFAIVMCDLNYLKKINDTYGHDTGDIYIKNCCKIICEIFAHSPVYRIGGDEFVVVLQGADYLHRELLMQNLDVRIIMAKLRPDIQSGKVSFAAGMAVYDAERDFLFSDVVKRADAAMYNKKRFMKMNDKVI